jgi:hypothetical protein
VVALLVAITVAAPPKLELVAPAESAVGDGKTAVQLTARLTKPGKLANVQITTDAGTVGEIAEKEPNTFSISFIPPRVVLPSAARLMAKAKSGKRGVKAMLVLRIDPPKPTVEELRSSGPLKMRVVGPLVFERQTTAEIVMQAPEGGPPSLVVNVGRIDAPRANDKGLAAAYSLPIERFPQVAVVAAVDAQGTVLDWLAMPLHGQPEITAKTEPNAMVTVRVGETDFGPLKADKKGKTTMMVVVPPGVPLGTTTAADRFGNQKQNPLDLRVPPFPRLLAVCSEASGRLLVVAVDAAGKPEAGADLVLTASRGALGPPNPLAPGLYESLVSLPKDVRVGEHLMLDAALRNDPGPKASCDFEARGGQPADVKLTLSSDNYVAGSGAPITVTARVVDSGGRAAYARKIEITADMGEVSAPKPLEPGTFTATWRPPDAHEGKRKAFVTARAGEDTVVSAEAGLELRAGRATKLEVDAGGLLVANGRDSTELRVRALDAHGNPVPGAALEAEARGTVGTFAYDEDDGLYRAVYTAPVVHEPVADDVVVREPSVDVRAKATLDLAPSLPPFVFGVKAGYAMNFGRIATPYYGADLAARLPLAGERVVLGAEGGFSLIESATGGADTVRSTLTLAPILGRLAFSVLLEPIQVNVAAGAGATLVRREVKSESAGEVAESLVVPAYCGRVDLSMGLGPGRLALEGSYRYSSLSEDRVQGNVGGLVVTAGYGFAF